MAIVKIVSSSSSTFTYQIGNGESIPLQRGDYRLYNIYDSEISDYKISIVDKHNGNEIVKNIPLSDIRNSNDNSFADLSSFYEYLSLGDDGNGLFFLNKSSGGSGGGSENGFIDYNDTTGSFSILADTWTDLPNDGAGAFTNKNYLPTGVTELIDVSTGYIDPTELDLGDTILIRNDYTINPNTNNAQLRFRYALGNGGGSYTLEKIVGRLDSGSGQDYRFSLSPDLIYMGDTNTRDNPIKIQVYCTSNATVTNAGSVIQVIKR